MTSRENFDNKWFYMKYIEKYLTAEKLLTRECTSTCFIMKRYFEWILQKRGVMRMSLHTVDAQHIILIGIELINKFNCVLNCLFDLSHGIKRTLIGSANVL